MARGGGADFPLFCPTLNEVPIALLLGLHSSFLEGTVLFEESNVGLPQNPNSVFFGSKPKPTICCMKQETEY